jgi:hypothetical protein
MLKWEDQLRSHPAYVKAATEASKIFVMLHDDPSLKERCGGLLSAGGGASDGGAEGGT